MLTALRRPSAAAPRSSRINPLPERASPFQEPAGAHEPPARARILFGTGTRLADLCLPVRINGDMAFFQGIMKEMLEAEDAHPGTVLDREFIATYTAGSRSSPRTCAARPGRRSPRRAGSSGQRSARPRAIADRLRATIACWAMGLTQHTNSVGTIQEVVNFLLLRGQHRAPGRRGLPGPRPQQRPGRPDHGDLREAQRARFLDTLGEEFCFAPPRAPRPRHGGHDQGDARRPGQGASSAWAATSSSATPDTEFTAEAPAAAAR